MNKPRPMKALAVVSMVFLATPVVHARSVDAEAGGPHQAERAAREWAGESRETREHVEHDMRQQEAQRREAAAEAARVAEAKAAEAKKAEIARDAKQAAESLAKDAAVSAVAKEVLGTAIGSAFGAGFSAGYGSEETAPADFDDKPGVTPEKFKEQQDRDKAERWAEPLRNLENAITRTVLKPL